MCFKLQALCYHSQVTGRECYWSEMNQSSSPMKNLVGVRSCCGVAHDTEQGFTF